MNTLTSKYITEHMTEIHTFESFGRAIADLATRAALQEAAKKGDAGMGESMEMTATVKVFAVQPTSCIGVEVCLPLVGCQRVHINH
jgi:hypothetical protein